MNAFALNAQQLIAIEQAESIALAREAGASAAGNNVWVNNQKQAALKLAGQAAPLISEWPSLLANLSSAIHAAGGSRPSRRTSDIPTFSTACLIRLLLPRKYNSSLIRSFS